MPTPLTAAAAAVGGTLCPHLFAAVGISTTFRYDDDEASHTYREQSGPMGVSIPPGIWHSREDSSYCCR